MHFLDLEVVMVCSLWCSHFGVCSHQAAVGELCSYAIGRLHRPISVIQITAGVENPFLMSLSRVPAHARMQNVV